MGKEIEALKHHTDALALSGDLAITQGRECVSSQAKPCDLSIDRDDASINALELGDASQERAFSDPDGPMMETTSPRETERLTSFRA